MANHDPSSNTWPEQLSLFPTLIPCLGFHFGKRRFNEIRTFHFFLSLSQKHSDKVFRKHLVEVCTSGHCFRHRHWIRGARLLPRNSDQYKPWTQPASFLTEAVIVQEQLMCLLFLLTSKPLQKRGGRGVKADLNQQAVLHLPQGDSFP
uniref:Uncharacterized protein n=1 Tax=Myotis myotis TaxID=51298 RepID=A0A7J8AM89_MYOMY|nr:hypothetical protein mMyoMyo1_007868 [Myotis myotis]